MRVEAQPINLAYTGRAIAPHTDNPYREPVPGIQLLHCLHSSAGGGENVLIDGFYAAEILRSTDPSAFATLTTTPLTFRYDDATTALRASAPAIELNTSGAVRGIRWNDRSVEPPRVRSDRVVEVYRSLRAFGAVIALPELGLHVTLAPGDCIVFDNTRVLHARTAFGGGARHLQGCYADLDGLASAPRRWPHRGRGSRRRSVGVGDRCPSRRGGGRVADPVVRRRRHFAGAPPRRRQALSRRDRAQLRGKAVARIGAHAGVAGWADERGPGCRLSPLSPR